MVLVLSVLAVLMPSSWAPGPIPGVLPSGLRPSVVGSSSPTIAASSSFAMVGISSARSSPFSDVRADTLLVCVTEHSSTSVSSVSDGLGNSFHLVGSLGQFADSNGPERVSIYAAYNLSHGGVDNVTVATASYAWTVVLVLDLRGVGAAPLDHISGPSNSSQAGMSLSTVSASVLATSRDLVLLVAGIRGHANTSAGSADQLVATNLSSAPYNSERGAVFEAIASANGTVTLTGSNSDPNAPWVAFALSFSPGAAWCGSSCVQSRIGVTSHGVYGFDATSGRSSSLRASAGGSVVVFVNIRGTVNASGVTDSLGDSYHRVAASTIGGCCRNGLALFDATGLGASSSFTVTASLASAAPAVVNVLVLSGVNSSSPIASRGAYIWNNYSTAVASTVSNPSDLTLLDVAEWGQYAIAAANDTRLDTASEIVPWQNETSADFYVNATPGTKSLTLGASLATADAWIALAIALNPGRSTTNASSPPTSGALAPPEVASGGSFALVGTSSGSSGHLAVYPGSALFAFVAERGSATVSSVNDTLGNGFAQVGSSGFYSDSLGPERVTVFAAFNVSHSGSDVLKLTTSSYAWTVVLIVDVNGTTSSPVDHQGSFANSSQAQQSPSTIRGTVAANTSDLVLMVGGVRGKASLNGSAGERVVATNTSLATYTSESAILVAEPWKSANGTAALSATSSSAQAPWVAEAIALRAAVVTHPIQHVVVLFLENEADYQVLQGGPYEAYLAGRFAAATHYYSVCHGSTPAYLAATSGAPLQCTSSALNTYNTTEIGSLLDGANLSWAAYQESMPSACDRGFSGEYVYYHNPFAFYGKLVNHTAYCDSHVVNSQSFNASVTNGTLANYSFYTPNLIDDCHNSTLASCDGWLKSFLAPMLNATSSKERVEIAHTLFLINYDESVANDSGGYNGTNGGHVYMVAVSPYSLGRSLSLNATQYNLLTTVEWLFGLGSCGNHDNVKSFPPLTGLFSFTSNGY